MVKREQIKRDAVVKVTKQMPGSGQPGPRVDAIDVGEELVVQGCPFSSGGMNLVKVKRKSTGETVDVLYAFVTNFCNHVPSG